MGGSIVDISKPSFDLIRIVLKKKGGVDISVSEAFVLPFLQKMVNLFDFLVLLEECVLLQDIEVSGHNSMPFLPNSLLLVLMKDIL